MAPRPQNINDVVADLVPHSPAPVPLQKKEVEEEIEIKRHPDFARMDKPFGFLEQHHFNWIWLTAAHVFGLWYFYLQFSGAIGVNTLPFELILGYVSGLGITVGCHRYWTHKTFKANKPLQVLLMLMQTTAGQYTIHKWSLDHRIHHKYTDTNADPHNSERGLWFSHIGWLYLPKHDDLKKKLKSFEMPDLEKDPIVKFQSRWYWSLLFLCHTAIPVSIFHYYYGLPWLYAFACNYRRYLVSLHFTWCVNSLAHYWGDKPYDKSISSRDNPIVSFLAVGEGWHNYHHTFPWDYKTSEFGWKVNVSTMLIDFFAWIGWATDMKTVSQKMLKDRLRRTGDGSHADADADAKMLSAEEEEDGDDFDYNTPADVTKFMNEMEQPLWGWGDEKMTDDFRNITKILRPDGIESKHI